MKKENPLIDKSLLFAARIVKLHKYLITEKKETIIAKQIVLRRHTKNIYHLLVLKKGCKKRRVFYIPFCCIPKIIGTAEGHDLFAMFRATWTPLAEAWEREWVIPLPSPMI